VSLVQAHVSGRPVSAEHGSVDGFSSQVPVLVLQTSG
jgi:hypothetical protein